MISGHGIKELAALKEERDRIDTLASEYSRLVIERDPEGQVVVDDDLPNRTSEGLIGVQVHVGGPMKVEYRNWRLKK